MGENENPNAFGSPDHIPGLVKSLLLWLGASTNYFAARLELLGIESKEILKRVILGICFLIVALVLLLFTYFFFIVGLIFLVHWLTGWNWMYITFGAAVLHFLGVVVCLIVTKCQCKGGAFKETIAEFKRDKEWLTRKHHTTRTH